MEKTFFRFIKHIPLVLAVLAVLILTACSISDYTTKPSKIGEVTQKDHSESEPAAPSKATEQIEESKKETAGTETKAPEKTVYQVGDIVEVKGLKIIYTASGEYTHENQYIQPGEGKKYIFVELYVENTGSSSASVSYFDFEAYADGYAVDQKYFDEKALSGSLSAGRWNLGRLYFEIPKDAKETEIEYEYNMFSNKKIKFAYEGEKNSGFTPEARTAPTEGAFVPGDIIEAGKFKISYLKCDYFTSDNMFVQPDEGNVFIYLEFEFENISSEDHSVNSLYFHCYADGKVCDGTSVRDDDLSAELSAGRKTKGTVAFQIPKDATTIEIEYSDNLFSDKYIVFSFKK